MSRIAAKALAIIPARGGSKGVPRKNVRLVCGQPLIAWTIQAAKAARSVERVVVSTDDGEIAAVASQFGADVVRRPAEISGDTASSELALLHAVETIESQQGTVPPLLAFLQCTSPLTLADDVDGTVRALIEGNADSALTVAPFFHFIWRSDEGNTIGVNHDKRIRPMRQARKAEFLETGAVYVMKTDGFRAARHRFFGRTVTHVVPSERSLEIDQEHDLLIAETFLRTRLECRRQSLLPRNTQAVIFDFDGVFTDNGVWVDQDGREGVVCRRDDGMGIQRLKRLGIPMLVLSTECNPVVSARARKLGIECVQGCGDKRAALAQWLDRHNIPAEDVVYLGNDINDLGCLTWVGCPVVVADAYPEAKRAARIVLHNPGGRGAVRELCDLIIQRAEAA